MNNETNKDVRANQPWEPGCWVADTKSVPVSAFCDDSRRKYAAVKANAAILRAMRHDQQDT